MARWSSPRIPVVAARIDRDASGHRRAGPSRSCAGCRLGPDDTRIDDLVDDEIRDFNQYRLPFRVYNDGVSAREGWRIPKHTRPVSPGRFRLADLRSRSHSIVTTIGCPIFFSALPRRYGRPRPLTPLPARHLEDNPVWWDSPRPAPGETGPQRNPMIMSMVQRIRIIIFRLLKVDWIPLRGKTILRMIPILSKCEAGRKEVFDYRQSGVRPSSALWRGPS